MHAFVYIYAKVCVRISRVGIHDFTDLQSETYDNIKRKKPEKRFSLVLPESGTRGSKRMHYLLVKNT